MVSMASRHRASTWAELQALSEAARESVLADLKSWTAERIEVALAHYWPASERQVRTARSPHGFAPRPSSGWPDCWPEHGALRDCLLAAYVWDREIATSKNATVGSDRAAYHEHLRRVLVPEVQAIAAMCELGHMDPAARPGPASPWQPAPPPLPDRPQPVGGTESPEDAAPPPARGTQSRPPAGSTPGQPWPWADVITRQRPSGPTSERGPLDR